MFRGVAVKKQALRPARCEECLQNFVPLSVGVSEVVALIYEGKVSVTVLRVLQQDIPFAIVSLQIARRQHAGIQLVRIVVLFPHLNERCGANDERADVVGALEMLHDGCADVALLVSSTVPLR